MDQIIIGNLIKKLREKEGLTQKELASTLYVSDKTVSKWETGRGFPDISILESIAKTFKISLNELLCGEVIINNNISSNMLKTKFYVCPICNNIITSTGDAQINCHGIKLLPLEALKKDIDYEFIEDEIFVKIDSKMTKDDYISFIAGVGVDNVQIVKLYPESSASTRIKRRGVKNIYYYSLKEGLFFDKVIKKGE